MKIIFIILFQSLLVGLFANTNKVFEAYANVEKGNYTLAIENFNALIESAGEDNNQYLFERANCYYLMQDYLKAKKDLLTLSENNFNDANLLLAKVNVRLGATFESFIYLERYFNNEKNPDIIAIKSDTAFAELSQTDKWIEFWLSKEESSLQILIADVKYYIQKGKFEVALNRMEDVEDNPEILYLKSISIGNLDNLPMAFQYINSAIKLELNNSDFLFQKASLLIKTEKYTNSIALLLRTIELKPQFFKAYEQLAYAYYKIGNSESAKENIDLLVNYFPENVAYKILATKIALLSNDNMQALKYVNEIIQKETLNAETYYLRGRAYFNMGTVKQALNDFAMSLDLNPDNADAYFNLGNCNYKMGDSKGACYNWNKAAEMGSNPAMKKLVDFCK